MDGWNRNLNERMKRINNREESQQVSQQVQQVKRASNCLRYYRFRSGVWHKRRLPFCLIIEKHCQDFFQDFSQEEDHGGQLLGVCMYVCMDERTDGRTNRRTNE